VTPVARGPLTALVAAALARGPLTALVAAARARGPLTPLVAAALARGPLTALVAAALILPAAAGPARAHAEAVTGAELRELAAGAARDPAALSRLRGVDRVDGRPADLAAALDGASGAELEARLEALAQQSPGSAPDAGGARREAREILAGRRFSPARLPGPFRGVLDRLAEWVAPVFELIPTLDDIVPGGRPVVWALIALAVAAGAAAVAARTLRRRTAGAASRAPAAGPPVPEGPEALERRAREAAARGEYELALRLGFRAGLGWLDRRGTIEWRPSLSTTEVARTLRSPDFDRVAARFDEVAYGGRRAAAADVDDARSAWATVLGDRRVA
jgi:hypothetical protein